MFGNLFRKRDPLEVDRKLEEALQTIKHQDTMIEVQRGMLKCRDEAVTTLAAIRKKAPDHVDRDNDRALLQWLDALQAEYYILSETARLKSEEVEYLQEQIGDDDPAPYWAKEDAGFGQRRYGILHVEKYWADKYVDHIDAALKDCKVHHRGLNLDTQSYRFYIEHPEFEVVPEGTETPRYKLKVSHEDFEPVYTFVKA